MASPPADRADTSKLRRLWREPTLHFFAIAAVALLGQRFVSGDPRTIEITPALKADLLRRYQDQLGRPITAAEADAFMAEWKADEALYREALREGLDRDDLAVRGLLVGKMRERLLLQTRLREPSDADLQGYLERHRDQFEAPLVYEHDYVTFDKRDPHAAEQRAKYERQLAAGATPESLGLRHTAANVTRERIQQDLGADVGEKIGQLPIGQWAPLETSDRLLLIKLIRIQGGLPDLATLKSALAGAWKAEQAQQAVSRAAKAVADRYRFREKSR